jgi:hypothetical protein
VSVPRRGEIWLVDFGQPAGREQAGRRPAVDTADWFRALRASAEALDAWHRSGQNGPRPPGHLRSHQIERAHARRHGLTRWVHSHVLDPDGSPPALKRDNRF